MISTCDKCGKGNIEAKRLDIGGGAGIHLCRPCWKTEMEWRELRNPHVYNPFPIMRWEEVGD